MVLKGVQAEETTKSGIILPNANEEKPKIFEVIAVSAQGVPNKNGEYKAHLLEPGQKVVCSQYAGDDIKIDDVEYKVISEDSITAIIED